MRKLAAVLCATMLFLLTAQTSGFCAGKGYLGLQLGPEFLTDDGDDNVDNALAFGIYGGYRVDKALALEAGLTTASHDVDFGGDLSITTLMFGPRISGQVDRNLSLYAGAGLGIYFVDYEHRYYDDSETDAGLYLGAGMEYLINRNLALGLDLKYHIVFDDDLDSDLVTLMFRLGFNL